jgi:imidazolonepropionase-like amidohydrolase
LAAGQIPVGPTLGGFTTVVMAAASPGFRQRLADAGLTPEALVEMRMSILRQMKSFGVRFISGADAGIGPAKAHGNYADAVIELSQVTGTVPALVAASSGVAAAIGLGRSKGRLHRGYDADVLVVGGDLAADLTALRTVRQVVLRGSPVPPLWRLC